MYACTSTESGTHRWHLPLTLVLSACPTPQLLRDRQILSAPVLDEEGEYLGAVSVPDILRALVKSE